VLAGKLGRTQNATARPRRALVYWRIRIAHQGREPFGPSRNFMCMITAQEYEVACVAHYMGYELMRARDGYVMVRKYGTHSEVVTAKTLDEITSLLKH
jgi:hypothetical protein